MVLFRNSLKNFTAKKVSTVKESTSMIPVFSLLFQILEPKVLMRSHGKMVVIKEIGIL
mgnify:CR=1 FL=1